MRRSSCWPRVLGLLGAALLTGLAIVPAQAAPPGVYVSEIDDGIDPGGPVEIPAGGSTILYLYIDGGTNPSPEIRCAQGTGDEVCGFDLDLAGQGGLAITGFTPQASIVFHLAGDTLGVVGGDAWFGTLGPQKLGEITVQGAAGGTLALLATSRSANASLGLESLGPSTLATLPEPGLATGLLSGAAWLAWLSRRRARAASRRSRSCATTLAAFLALLLCIVAPTSSSAQVSTDCGDVVPDGVIDVLDLDALRQFLANDPGAPDLQGDPQLLARCDVSGDGFCRIDDWSRIRRYMLDLTGGLNETCPLVGSTYPPVVLPPPTVDQVPPISTSDASVLLSGTADPGHIIRVVGTYGHPATTTEADGTWEIELPLVFNSVNALQVFRDHGAGYLSEAVAIEATQTSATGISVVEGRIVHAHDGTAIEGATVQLDSMIATSDLFGIFQFAGVPSGRVFLAVDHPDFIPESAYTSTDWLPPAPEIPSPREIGLVPRAATTIVGSGGGTVTSAAGVVLEVPPGALVGDTAIALTDLPSPRTRSLGGLPVVDIGPGPVTFDPPAVLRLPTSLPSGVAGSVEFQQVNQATGASSTLLGFVNNQGEVEIEIGSSQGDSIVWDIDRDDFVVIGTEEDQTVTFPFGNCTPVFRVGGFEQNRYNFKFLPSSKATSDPFWGPTLSLGTALWEDDGRLKRFQDGAYPIVPIAIPPGTTQVWEVKYDTVRVRQKIYAYRNRGDGLLAERELLGELQFDLSGYKSATPKATGPHPECGCLMGLGGCNPFASSASGLAPAQTCEEQATSTCNGPSGGAWGDPHLIRFDHLGAATAGSNGDGRYDFQASGEFVLFESTEDDLVAQVRLQPANNSTTVGRAVAVDVEGDRVSIYGGQPVLDVRIEGIPTPLMLGVPVPLPGGGELERATTGFGTDSVTIRWSDGSELLVRAWGLAHNLSFFPGLSPSRFGRVRGLLGNANANLTDDVTLRDGTPVASDPSTIHSTYADSWRISQLESLFDYEPGEDTSTYNGTPIDPDYTVDDLDPIARANAEAQCMAAGIVDEPLFSDCVLDTAVVGSDATNASADTLQLVPDVGTYVAVPGDANIFAAGLGSVPDLGGGGGNGSLPVEIALPLGTQRILRVLDSAGTISVSASETDVPPDGLAASPIAWSAWGGLAGPSVNRKGIAMGVFLDASGPPVAAPASYACGDATARYVAPEIGQIFCLGDGRTAFGEPQFVLVPDAATRLFLGQADRRFLPHLELADIVGGGDGTGTGSIQAIDIANGGVTTTHAQALNAPTNVFTPATHLFVDGVVIPDGGVGGSNTVPISSTGLTVTGISDSTGNNGQSLTHTWDHVWNGHANGVSSSLTGSILGFSTNKGITFDLDAIEAAFPGAEAVSASVVAAMGNTTNSNSTTDYYVFVDGVLRSSTQLSGAVDGPNTTRFVGTGPLASDSRFLTLIASSAGWTNFDWSFWLDSTIELDTTGVPPGHYGDNSGMHEFVIEVSQ